MEYIFLSTVSTPMSLLRSWNLEKHVLLPCCLHTFLKDPEGRVLMREDAAGQRIADSP